MTGSLVEKFTCLVFPTHQWVGNSWPFSLFYCLLFLLKFVFPLVICIISNFFSSRVVFPGRLTTPSVPYVWWQVSLMRAACLYGRKSFCGGALLPQGVFPLLNLRLCAAPGRTCLWLKTRFVPWSTWLKTLCIQLTTSYWGPALLLQENCTANFTLISSTMGQTYAGICRSASWVLLMF